MSALVTDRDIQALLGFAHAAAGLPAPTPIEVEAWCAFESLHRLTVAEAKAAVVAVIEAEKAPGARWSVSVDQVLAAARRLRRARLAGRQLPAPPVDPDDTEGYLRWQREWVAAVGRGMSDEDATALASSTRPH